MNSQQIFQKLRTNKALYRIGVQTCHRVTLASPKNQFERPLQVFWLIKLGEAEDQRLQLFEPQASFVIA
jgi:hypothetical protein